MRSITLLQVPRLVFGEGAFQQFIEDVSTSESRRLFILTIPPLLSLVESAAERFQAQGLQVTVRTGIDREPDFGMFEEMLGQVRDFDADCVAGIGGGSVLDVAKLLAAFARSGQPVRDAVGIGKLEKRDLRLICLPSTSGTGSEVSPNAILLDERDNLKKGIVSPWLVPDATYSDPELTYDLPAAITAATGLDALTHCLEAYTNKFAHPVVDLVALDGVRLVNESLLNALRNGHDAKARANLALGSLYGGMCLGPVNTAAVHALSYPLGGTFHIAHGLSNAILLPHVMEFNLPAAPARHANLALALGAAPGRDDLETARRGVRRIRTLIRDCGIEASLSELGIPRTALPDMARSAMEVTRLLRNNVRDVTYDDALAIYEQAYEAESLESLEPLETQEHAS